MWMMAAYSVPFLTRRCLNPILSMIVMSTIDNEMGATSLTDKSTIREQKLKFHETSDHIAIIRCLKEWKQKPATIGRYKNLKKMDSKFSSIIKKVRLALNLMKFV